MVTGRDCEAVIEHYLTATLVTQSRKSKEQLVVSGRSRKLPENHKQPTQVATANSSKTEVQERVQCRRYCIKSS